MQLSISILRGLAAYLRDQGIATDVLLHDAGLPSDLLTRGDASIDMERLGQAIAAAFALVGDRALGLRLGQSAPLQTLAIVGEVTLHAPTLRTALTDAQRYLPLLIPMSRLRLAEEADQSFLVFEPALSDGRAVRFATEVTLGFAARIARHFDSRRALVKELHVRYAPPKHADEYSRVFQCPVYFETARNELVIPTALLDLPQPFPDQALWTALRRRADELLVQERSREQLHERVRHVLQHEIDLANVNPSYIARRLDISPRSLRRRLGDEGHSLSALTDEVRRELAISELLNPDMPIKRIADRVGFSEVSAFHRAFKRWTGVTPARYRARYTVAEAS